MRNEFTAIIEKDDNWYIAYCPEIPGANGQGMTKEEPGVILGRQSPSSSKTAEKKLDPPIANSVRLRREFVMVAKITRNGPQT